MISLKLVFLLYIIKVTTFDKFEESIDKEEWLSQQHLDPSKPTILMSAGAFGVSKGFDYMINNILEKVQIRKWS